MNELHYAHRVRQHLNLGLHELPAPMLDKLAAAREKALAHQKQAVRQTVLATAGSFFQQRFDNLRYKQLLGALLVLLTVVLSAIWMADSHIAEQSTIDSELLADELPIGAFTDKGFAAWLNRDSPE